MLVKSSIAKFFPFSVVFATVGTYYVYIVHIAARMTSHALMSTVTQENEVHCKVILEIIVNVK